MSSERQITSVHLERNPWTGVFRAGWIFLALLSLVILIASIPGYLATSFLGIFENYLVLEHNTLAFTLTRATLLTSFLGALSSFSLAVFLFLKKSSDRIGLFLAYYLLGHSILFAGPIEMLYPFWEAAPWINSFVLLPAFFGPATAALIALFPDGRFVPPWSRWFIPVSFLSFPASLLYSNNHLPIDIPVPGPLNPILATGLGIISVTMITAAVYAQVYRYRFVSTPVQKQQTKWVLYGFGLWVVINTLTSFGWVRALQLPEGTPVPAWLPLSTLVWVASSFILPISLTISITRFRLFEIDLIINRTLVYGTLTAGVIGLYVGVVGALGTLFQAQNNLLIALLATGLVAVLFQPLRDRLQRGINRLIFGERDNPVEVLSRLGRSLETALPPAQVLPALVETIARTLKLPFVGIAIRGQPVVDFGQPCENMVMFPLIFQGETAGELLAAPRSPGESFTSAEMRLLRNLARQAGAAVRNAQLAADLQRSRQNLVTTREEERHRLRRDLHDGIGPSMAGLILKLDAARDMIASDLENGGTAQLEEAVQLLAELKAQAQKTVKDVRRIVNGLRPPSLDVLGLAPALHTHIGQVAAPAGPHIQLVTSPPDFPRLSAAVEVAAYHIVLEAVTNVIHHARAQRCDVSLALENEQLCIEIADDGVGIPHDRPFGVGLNSMRERAEELGGSFELNSYEKGTRICARIPVL